MLVLPSGDALLRLFIPFLVVGYVNAWILSKGPRRLHRDRKLPGRLACQSAATTQHTSHQLILPKSGRLVAIKSRTMDLTADLNVTIWEWDQPASIVEHYWNVQNLGGAPGGVGDDLLDPFGLVSWPGAVVAAQEMKKYQDEISNATVLVLGAGTGVEAQAVAMLGASRVVATDIHPTTLLLLRHGAEKAGLSEVISEQVLDIFSSERLPDCDVLLAADVLYNPTLANQVGKRCQEALKRNPAVKIVVSDSQRFHGTDFVPDLNDFLASQGLETAEWNERTLLNFTGSGVMVDEDQTYNVSARVLCYGWGSRVVRE